MGGGIHTGCGDRLPGGADDRADGELRGLATSKLGSRVGEREGHGDTELRAGRANLPDLADGPRDV